MTLVFPRHLQADYAKKDRLHEGLSELQGDRMCEIGLEDDLENF